MISYGGYLFTAPERLSLWRPRVGGGVYVVQVFDSGWRPQPFRPIYFGKSVDLSDRIGRGHEVYPRWVQEAGGSYGLFVSTFSSDLESKRAHVERTLIDRYQPACNRAGVSLEELFFRRALELKPSGTLARLAALASRRPLPGPPAMAARLSARSLFQQPKRASLGDLLGNLGYSK